MILLLTSKSFTVSKSQSKKKILFIHIEEYKYIYTLGENHD